MNPTTKEIFSIKREVERLLNKYVVYRDNDELLVAKIWWIQLKNAQQDPRTLTAEQWLIIYSQNDLLTPADTIIRARAKAQQEHQALRGHLWEERHATGQKVAEQINLFK